MQIERLVRDPEYAQRQAAKGGAFFQGWTSGLLPGVDFAPVVARDALRIYDKRQPLPETITRVLEEIEHQAQPSDPLKIAFVLGWMTGKAHERWRVNDPEAKRLLWEARRKGRRAALRQGAI